MSINKRDFLIYITKKFPRKPTAFRRGMNWENYFFIILIIFQFVAIFIVIYNNKLRRGIYELASNGKTIEPLGFEAVASEPRIPQLK